MTLTFDLLTLKVVSESRVTWATSVPILVFLGFSVFELGPTYATDRRQTKASLNASALRIHITRLGPSVQSTGQLQHNTTAMASHDHNNHFTTTTTTLGFRLASLFFPSPKVSQRRTSSGWLVKDVLQGGCPSCHPANIVCLFAWGLTALSAQIGYIVP